MKNTKFPQQGRKQYAYAYLLTTSLYFLLSTALVGQCVTQPGTVDGFVFQDINNNGSRDAGESPIANVRVQAYDAAGSALSTVLTDINGNYKLNNLPDGKEVRLTFLHASYADGFMGADNGTRVQFVTVPACQRSVGLTSSLQYCNDGTRILTTCFVQGPTSDHPAEPTIVGLDYGFNLGSAANKFAMYSETGTVWGVAWNKREKALYSSAFIKQYGGLTPHGHDAIFKTVIPDNGMPVTTLFAKLSNLGLNAGTLTTTDINHCNYGAQVGKIGLGALEISADMNYLYTVNLYNNNLVIIPTNNPTAANTKSIQIPDPGCSNGEYRAFALKVYNGKVYVGVTCTAETAKTEAASTANVYEFDPAAKTFTLIFTTDYLKGYWKDSNADQITTMQWLTDIDFTDDGNMLLALSDRTGHRYCTVNFTNRLDDQRPDLLLVGYNKNSKTWTLENNGAAAGLSGSGIGNGEGPGGGEFFGFDHWPKDPAYHPEVALGSIFVMPGTNSVVATVFDPHLNAYSGGLHRYSTTNGGLLGVKELYRLNTTVAFGKATGFGDIIATCTEPNIEIGNRVWEDINKNGLQDAGEKGFSGVGLVLYDAQCNPVAQTVTDEKGQYAFNASNVINGLQSGAYYYIGIDPGVYDANANLFNIGSEYYSFTGAKLGEELIGNKGKENLAGCATAQVAVQTAYSNQNYDLGLVKAAGCGVIIHADVVNAEAITKDQTVTYEICITNTGATPITAWTIEHLMAAGQSMEASLNPEWSSNGNVNTGHFVETLGKGSTICKQIHLNFIPGDLNIQFGQTFTLTKIWDFHQQPVEDLTSCASTAEDLIVNVTPAIFDLALKHELNENKVFTFGSEVKINTTVYNQGNRPAQGYTVVNYLNDVLDFNPAKNPGWELSQDGLTLSYKENETLYPGENKTFMVLFTLKSNAPTGSIINYAEIMDSRNETGDIAVDFDSQADEDVKNDMGGEPNGMTDNMITDHGIIDEDDQDPVVILLNLVDVALVKTAENREISPGEESLFRLEIINQGTITIDKLVLRDYIPNGLSLIDPEWTALPNNIVERIIKLEKPLLPGKSAFTSIMLRVSETLTGPKVLTNVAQVYKIYDENGHEISDLDIDSNLSLTVENTESTVMLYIGQDNYSYADVVLLGNIDVPEPCNCLNNATDADNGQFDIVLSFESASGETWYIEQIVGLYDVASPAPPAAPISFLTGPGGFLLDETDLGNGLSTYSLEGIHVDGQGLFVIFKNEYDIVRSYLLNQDACRYNTFDINGSNSVCSSITSEYSVPQIPGAYYAWTLDGSPFGGNTNSITVNWNMIPEGNHVIGVALDDSDFCYAPATLNVASGVGDVEAISCISNINVSLNEDCRFTVTPNVLVAGNYNASSPYQVMLTDMHGNAIPNATLTKEHLGQHVMAKLIDGCGGNSCWATILVEDKIPPVTFCQDITIACHELDVYVGPFESDNCGEPVENILLNEAITTYTCDPNFIKHIDRAYQAKDKSGNLSKICEMRIYVARPDLDQVVMPENLTMANGNPLVCDNFPVDEEGRPSVEVTGVPTLFGVSLYPEQLASCHVFAGFVDRDLGKINCTRKIAREWLVYEWWCTNGVPDRVTQIIEITDTIPPVIEPIADVTVSAAKGDCMAWVDLPLAQVSDECEGVLRVDIVYPGGFLANQYTGHIQLPSGDHVVTYTVYDECGNSSNTSFNVTVVDKTAPTVICKGEVIVALNFQGEAYVRPSNINDGSWDACGISHFEVRRMGDACETGTDVFGPLVDFCCEDVGDTIMVEMRVTDFHENTNSCMIPIVVQDKFAPLIECPDDIEISCDTPIDLNDLSEYGTATAIDACGATVRELTPIADLNQCRQGTIERIFEARDEMGFARCSQFIEVVNYDPFTNADVTRPLDFETSEGCTALDLHPDNLLPPYNYPVIAEDFCDNVGVTFDDQVFNFVPGACFKIVRTWYVLDWCAMAADSNYVPYTFQQTIKVQNTIAPVITSSCETVDVCTPKDNCDNGYVELIATADDVCTPDNLLHWAWKIDLDNDGTYEYEDSGFGGETDASDIYPVGNHRVQFSFEDRCGNVTTCDKFFNIQNCDTPTAICVERISIGLVPMDMDGDGENEIEMACITAASLDAGSYHACSDSLCFAFSATDTAFTEYCYDCFDLGTNEITLYVIDKIGGGVSECVVIVEVQDNNDVDVCPDLEECIVWPDSVEFTGCSPQFPSVGFNKIPQISSTCDCNDVTVTHVDNPPSPCGPNCQTTSRIWTVTFNCYDRPISYTYSQRITIYDDTPNANITGDNIICTGESTTLTASGGGTYLWSTGATTTSITVSPVINTTYRVTVTSSLQCTAVAQITVTVNPLPSVSIQGDLTICVGESTTLTASGGVAFIWSTGATTASINVNPVSTTQYRVTVTNAQGCTASASASVVVNPLPTVAIQGTSPICVGQSTTLTASGGTSYLWSTGQTTAMITVSPASTQQYTVTVTNQNTCSNTGTFNVVVNPLPVVVVTGDNLICRGENTILTASGGTSYLWSTGQTTSSIVVSPTMTTNYTVTVTNSNNCSNTGSRTVTVNPSPNAVITGDTVICVGESTTLTASGGGTYLWSTGATTASIQVTPATTTGYSVTVTNAQGCTDVASVSVEVGSGLVTCETVDTSVYLDDMGMVLITPGLISVGDTIGCNGEILVEVDPGIFFCNQVGVQEVRLRVINVATNDTLTCFADVTVLDTIPPSIICPADTVLNCLDYDPDQPITVFGSATIDDNCQVGLDLDEVVIPNLNVCNVGIITRTFTVIDNSGNTSQCVQTIEIEPSSPLMESDITWPQDTVIINTCEMTDPQFTGMPEYDEQVERCSDIFVDFEDTLIPIDGGGCPDTIIRMWTVIDSCHLVAGTNNGIFTFIQTIFLIDTTPPVFLNLPNSVIDIMLTPPQCDTFVDLSGILVQDCSNNLILSNNGLFADNPNSIDPSGTYDAGIYNILLTAIDECGNESEYQFVLRIHAFREVCTKQFLHIPDTCTLILPANQFYVYDNVCPQSGHFFATYSLNHSDSIKILDCSNVTEVGVDVIIYLWDTRSGDTILWDSCITQYFLTDPDSLCMMCLGGRVTLNGSIQTHFNIPVMNVEVDANGMISTTNEHGTYINRDVIIGEGYEVIPKKKDGVLEGVSTLDLVFIQRHITGLGVLGSPYDLLAADINNDRKVNTIDLVELRKTILGIHTTFPNNDSWRMLPQGFSFLDQQNPFATPIPSSYYIESMPGNMRVDFTGVKVGDVNQSYRLNSEHVESRTGEGLVLQIQDRKIMSKGSKLEIPVSVMTSQQLSGFQFVLNIGQLQQLQLSSEVINLKPEHFHVSNGYLVISWSDVQPVDVAAGAVLFTIRATSGATGHLKDFVQLEPEYLSAEAYTEALQVRQVYLHFGQDQSGHEDFVVLGNAPNPWSQTTNIRFYLPASGMVDMHIRDITGKLLMTRTHHFDKGVQEFQISRNELQRSGVLYYELKFQDHLQTGKMVLIE